MQRQEMQHSMEVGAEITRASLDAATRIGHHTIEAYRQCATLQADTTVQLLDESVRITKVFLGDGDAREAFASWSKACERGLKRSFEASRGIAESVLKAQSEMIEAAGQMIAARNRIVTENLEQIGRTAESAAHATSATLASRAATAKKAA